MSDLSSAGHVLLLVVTRSWRAPEHLPPCHRRATGAGTVDWKRIIVTFQWRRFFACISAVRDNQ
jgi:hypothetical protein